MQTNISLVTWQNFSTIFDHPTNKIDHGKLEDPISRIAWTNLYETAQKDYTPYLHISKLTIEKGKRKLKSGLASHTNALYLGTSFIKTRGEPITEAKELENGVSYRGWYKDPQSKKKVLHLNELYISTFDFEIINQKIILNPIEAQAKPNPKFELFTRSEFFQPALNVLTSEDKEIPNPKKQQLALAKLRYFFYQNISQYINTKFDQDKKSNPQTKDKGFKPHSVEHLDFQREAFRWLWNTAHTGFDRAQKDLGMAYWKGLYNEHNFEKAKEWFIRSVSLDNLVDHRKPLYAKNELSIDQILKILDIAINFKVVNIQSYQDCSVHTLS